MDRWHQILLIWPNWITNGYKSHTLVNTPGSHVMIWFEEFVFGDDWTPLGEMMDPPFTLDIGLFTLDIGILMMTSCAMLIWWWWGWPTIRVSVLMMSWGPLTMIYDLWWGSVTFHHALHLLMMRRGLWRSLHPSRAWCHLHSFKNWNWHRNRSRVQPEPELVF